MEFDFCSVNTHITTLTSAIHELNYILEAGIHSNENTMINEEHFFVTQLTSYTLDRKHHYQSSL